MFVIFTSEGAASYLTAQNDLDNKNQPRSFVSNWTPPSEGTHFRV